VKFNILLVDYSETDAEKMTACLSNGYKLFHVRTLADAIEALGNHHGEQIDAVFMELNCPDADRDRLIAFAKTIRRGLPVVIVTNCTDDDVIESLGKSLLPTYPKAIIDPASLNVLIRWCIAASERLDVEKEICHAIGSVADTIAKKQGSTSVKDTK